MNGHAIKSGVTIGIISIVVSLLLYIIDSSLLASMWVGISIFVLIIFLVSYFGIQHRKEIGGYLDFGNAWIYSIQVFVVAGIIGTLFNILLYNVVDPDLPEIIAEQAVENAESMMQRFGMPEDQMDEALEKARTDTLDRLTVVGSLKGFLWALIFYAVFSVITGLIIKKKEPEFEG